MHLSEKNQRLSKEVDKGKEKRKKILENHSVCHAKAGSLLGEAVTVIQSRDDEIANLNLEKQNLQWQLEDLLDPEEPKKKLHQNRL